MIYIGTCGKFYSMNLHDINASISTDPQGQSREATRACPEGGDGCQTCEDQGSSGTKTGAGRSKEDCFVGWRRGAEKGIGGCVRWLPRLCKAWGRTMCRYHPIYSVQSFILAVNPNDPQHIISNFSCQTNKSYQKLREARHFKKKPTSHFVGSATNIIETTQAIKKMRHQNQ